MNGRGTLVREYLRDKDLKEAAHVSGSFLRVVWDLVALVNVGKADINWLINK